MAAFSRLFPIGAEVIPGGGVSFRVWAPDRQSVDVVIEGGPGFNPENPTESALTADNDGYYSGIVPATGDGTHYRFRLDKETDLYPDPASKFQPSGPFGTSEVIDPGKYAWQDAGWPGISIKGQIIYETHVGTYTRAGTWESLIPELDAIARTGITVIELMPVAEFPGRFGWGYDGVDLFAPSRLYGRPDDFRRFVDRAHGAGLGVILDVVYNHFGPSGNYVGNFTRGYFTDRYMTEWGEAINFDGERAGPVREFFVANAVYWIKEYHLDGFRLDATQAIFDSSKTHIIAEITGRAREAAGNRSIIMLAENEPQLTRIAKKPEDGGYGCDALWNDDFHHSAVVALTGHNEAYYMDYLGKPQEFISSIKWGYIYQGQCSSWQNKIRGTPSLKLKPYNFVLYIQNHDQVANSSRGLRIHRLTSPGRYRAMTALTLLAPGTPLLFQGQEFAVSSPFLYFADISELSREISSGRITFLSQFPSLAQPEMRPVFADPGAFETFERCKIDTKERETHQEAYVLHCDLLALRREDPVLSEQRQSGVDGAVLGEECFILRYFDEDGNDRLLVVNLGRDLHLSPAPEPLLAPPEGKRWRTLWSTEDPRYGGNGTPPLYHPERWFIPGEAAVLLG